MAPEPNLTRAAKLLGVAGIVWFTLAAAWGTFGTLGGGHYAQVYGIAISAENMMKWGILGPVPDYAEFLPATTSYYCHHPFGSFWMQLPLLRLLGHQDWIVYVPAVVLSALTALLVNRTAQSAWGTLGATAATLGFVMLPITLAFSNFNGLEVNVTFGWALFFWGHSRMLATWKKRHALASVLGAALAANGDWVGLIVVAVVLVYTMLRGFVLPARFFPPIRERLYARWWIFTCAAVSAIFFVYVALFFKWHTITDLLESGYVRSTGSQVPLRTVLAARTYRIDASFTPAVIFLGKIAAPIALVRLIVLRRDEELFSLATLIAATIQYVAFTDGADIHVYWPHYFGLYFAFAFAQLVMTLAWLVERALGRRARREHIAFAVGLAAVCLFTLTVAPDALRGLRTGRETWGRYNQERLRSDANVVRVLETLAKRLPAGAYVDTHQNLDWSWHMSWALHGLHQQATILPIRMFMDPKHPFFVADASALKGPELRSLAKEWHLEIYGDILVIDERRPAGALDAYTFEEREPNALEWYFVSGIEPVARLAHDAFATWEWRTHLGQPAEAPTVEPRTPNELRIAHNIAVASNDSARAEELRRRIDALLVRVDRAELAQGVALIGTRSIGGVMPRAEVWLSAAGPTEGEAKLDVSARMNGAERWSWIPPDTLVRALHARSQIPTTLWRPGFLYAPSIVLYHRIGAETFSATWAARDRTALTPAAANPVAHLLSVP